MDTKKDERKDSGECLMSRSFREKIKWLSPDLMPELDSVVNTDIQSIENVNIKQLLKCMEKMKIGSES